MHVSSGFYLESPSSFIVVSLTLNLSKQPTSSKSSVNKRKGFFLWYENASHIFHAADLQLGDGGIQLLLGEAAMVHDLAN